MVTTYDQGMKVCGIFECINLPHGYVNRYPLPIIINSSRICKDREFGPSILNINRSRH